MKRMRIAPRPDFADYAREIGFEYHTIDGKPYWQDEAYYAFTLRQIEDDLEAPSEELAAMCVDLIDSIVASEAKLDRLRIPAHARPLIAESWKRRDPSLYGRFDLVYDGRGPARLLEYNADTPTSLFEAGVVQWHWLENARDRGALPSDADQFNSIHDRLIDRWRELAAGQHVHFTCMKGNVEDESTISYLADCAVQAGASTSAIYIDDIGLSGDRFVDMAMKPIDHLFKLYPWEWMFGDEFSRSAAMSSTDFMEPAWKALLSNKGLLALLWEKAPGHPNLLPAYFENDPKAASLARNHVRKPLYSREGANVEIVDRGRVAAQSDGTYGAEGYVLQELAMAPRFDGLHTIIGSWIVGDSACGIGIREDPSAITGNTSCFAPHAIL
ncbi:glutathionylspermidine synthase family protein [Terripilifer ovatus]|uniref:glutathionylspermidine synthase family protein n=1 Tax=Terripilifer ovatus TaxID=3032367 RepID=UPI003AB96E45